MARPDQKSGWFDLSFQTKLVLGMCGVVLLTGVVIFAVADRTNRSSTQVLVNSLFREVSSHAVTQTRDYVLRAAPVARSLEELADSGLAVNDMDRLAPQLLAFLKGNPGMTWVLYGDESGDYTGATRLADGSLHIERTHIQDGKTHLTEYQVLADGSWKVVREETDSHYDPRTRPFYLLAKEKGRLAWTPPYMFFTQGVPGISCAVPLKAADGRLRGVFSVEFDLNALSEFVAALSVSEHSRVFLFTPDQTLIAHPNQRNLRRLGRRGAGELLKLSDTGDPLVEAFRPHLRDEFVRPTGSETFHFFPIRHEGTDYLASTTVFSIDEGQPWVIGQIAPESDFLTAVWRTRWLSLAAAAGALLVAATLAAMMARHISRPVQSLITFMGRVGEGDLEATADFHGGREFRRLSAALNQMIADLRERLRLRSSLDVAMEVQNSLLPAADPVSKWLDVAGRTKYCDQTGGDYFDFIDVEKSVDSSLLVAVGDVMGHGIAAALLMATARAALRSRAVDNPSLGALMSRINQVLATNNRHNRFMTLQLLEINGKASTVRWASAGHDPAIVFDPATDAFHDLDGGDIPLGIDEKVEYGDFTSPPLAPGSILAIGTDGVWETFNSDNQQYGKDRLRSVIRANHNHTADQIAVALETDLANFRGERSPEDDVTFVVVKFVGSSQGP